MRKKTTTPKNQGQPTVYPLFVSQKHPNLDYANEQSNLGIALSLSTKNIAVFLFVNLKKSQLDSLHIVLACTVHLRIGYQPGA
jgi:hypothetical protein